MVDTSFGSLCGALVIGGLVACSSNDTGVQTATDRGAAEPVEGQTELLTLPHGDTLTVPVGYTFLKFQGIDSLVGRLEDGAGTTIFEYDGCGVASPTFAADNGRRDYSVNAEFFHGRLAESSSGLLVTFPTRGPSNFRFDEAIADEDALGLARTLTALTPHADDSLLNICRLIAP